MQTNTADDYEKQAEAIESIADKLDSAESIAEDCPLLSELFHQVRTGGKSPRDGKYVALLDYDSEEDSWTCRRVTFVRSGTHLRDTGADEIVSYKPFPFLSVDQFAEQVGAGLNRDARATRQTAEDLRLNAKQAPDPGR